MFARAQFRMLAQQSINRTSEMKAFKFKLESVLAIRVRALEKIQQKHADQQQRVLKFQTLLQENEAQLQELLSPSSKTNALLDPIAETQRFAYIQFLKAQRQSLQDQYQTENKVLTEIRLELNQALMKKKALNILKEKQCFRYVQLLQSKELQETDDLLVQRFGRH